MNILNTHFPIHKWNAIQGGEHQPVPDEWLTDNELEIRQEIERLTIEKDELPQPSGDNK